MTLNPTLKSILVRTAYIVGSLTIYYIAYNYWGHLQTSVA